MRSIAVMGLLALALAGVSSAQAQKSTADKPMYLTTDISRTTGKPEGWSYAVTLAANLNVSSNRDVVGQMDGNSVLFGGTFLGGVYYLRGPHELLNTLALAEAYSRTPAIDDLVKSTDLVELQILYNYFVNDWTGPFLRLGAQTNLFKTHQVTAENEVYVNKDVPTETTTSSKLRLSDSFQPFTISESLGWFVKPVRSEPLNVSFRAGFGGRHTFAEGALAVTDDNDTEDITEYTVLKDVHQAGIELFAGLDGKQMDGKLLYALGLITLFPLINNDDDDRSIAELTRVGLTGAVGMNVMSWLSVNYQLKVMRDIQLVDAVQVQNMLLLSLQYARATPNPAAKKPEKLSPETEARIAALEARAAAAEQRAAAAEARTAEPPALPEPPAEPAPQ